MEESSVLAMAVFIAKSSVLPMAVYEILCFGNGCYLNPLFWQWLLFESCVLAVVVYWGILCFGNGCL